MKLERDFLKNAAVRSIGRRTTMPPGNWMKFAFMLAERAHFPVAFVCQQLEVARSGYHVWCKRVESRRSKADRKLVVEIRAAHQRGRGEYGSPRFHRELRAAGAGVGRRRVARLMREHHTSARRRRSYVNTTHSKQGHRVAPNVLQRRSSPTAMNQVWRATSRTCRQGSDGSDWLWCSICFLGGSSAGTSASGSTPSSLCQPSEWHLRCASPTPGSCTTPTAACSTSTTRIERFWSATAWSAA